MFRVPSRMCQHRKISQTLSKLAYPSPLFSFESEGETSLSFKNTINIGTFSKNHKELNPSPEFTRIFKSTLSSSVYIDPIFRNQAFNFKNGFMHINDQRVQNMLYRVNDPQDIIGMVYVENGEMVAGTYQDMPTHCLYTNDGLFQVPEFTFNRLVNNMQAST